MKYLNVFQSFDWVGFSKNKRFQFLSSTPWVDSETKKIRGMIAECVIISDETNYGEGRDGTNRFEKIRFRVNKSVSIPYDAIVEALNASAKVWGDYHNNLSVTCDDLRIVEKRGNKDA